MSSDLQITTEDPTGPVSTQLIAELSAELAQRYPDSYGGDGSGAFKPADALVPGAAFVVAWRGGEAVGCGALRPMPESGVGEVKRMYVHPSVRRQRIGWQILSALEDLARGFGYHTLVLETGTRNPEALALYELYGYRLTECYGIYVNEPLSRCFEKTL
jgi:GNAT superfamily N-acetyltransferase